MDLQFASAWLDREIAGFAEIHEFAAQCRDAARSVSRESAALVLLAQAAATFAERQEGVAVNGDVIRDFLVQLNRDAVELRDASCVSDSRFIEALNRLAGRSAKDLCV
jgi:hypothetical protein